MLTIGIGFAVVVLAAAFVGLYRPWQLRWGATADELARSMPGDDLVHRPKFNATRAITVSARPEEVWPWLVQIGFGRAGWYSYDLLDNLGRRSVEQIVPELQHSEPGDLVPIGPGKSSGMWVKEVEPNRWMLWWNNQKEQTTWAWGHFPLPNAATRLVTRVRAPYTLRQPLRFSGFLCSRSPIFP